MRPKEKTKSHTWQMMINTMRLNQLPPPPPGKTGWPWNIETSSKIYENNIIWPKIAIVTPSFNQGEFIEETIRSILLQNYPNLEYIIIDGGSTDNTVEIIKKYDSWITYWISEPDNGQADALNKGFRIASGQIFGYLNSDDILAPNTLFKVAAHFMNYQKERVILSGRLETFPEKNSMQVNPKYSVEDWIKLIAYTVPQPSTFWTNHQTITSFHTQYNYAFDRLFFIELRLNGYSLHVTDDIFAFFRLHGNSKTVSSKKLFFEENKKINLELAKTHFPSTFSVTKKNYAFLEAKETLQSSQKINLDTLSAIKKMIQSKPIVLTKKWLYGWIKYLTINALKKAHGKEQ